MTANGKHSNATSVHVVCNWEYADEAARTGATGFAAEDVGKFAWQQDDDTIWILTATTPTWAQVGGSSGGGFYASYACIADQKSQNTDGGTLTQGSWQTRELNTEINDDDGIVSITSNQFTLGAGTYDIDAIVPAFRVNQHQARLYNISDSAVELVGTVNYSDNGTDGSGSYSFIKGSITIEDTKTFEIQHQCATTKTSQGCGIAANFGTEQYTVVEIRKRA